MKVRGHWQPVDTEQIYATRTHTSMQTHRQATAQSLAQRVTAVVFCCCWSLGPSSSRYQSLLFSAPLPDPLNWERLWLRKRERAKETDRGRTDSCAKVKESKNKRMKASERSKELRPVRANADQAEGLMRAQQLASWKPNLLPPLHPLPPPLWPCARQSLKKKNVAFQYSIW